MTGRATHASGDDADLGYSFSERRSGEVAIARDGRQVTVLRGAATERFRRLVARLGEQQAMARTTGNYRRGNERAGS
jgi:hypothetical protein